MNDHTQIFSNAGKFVEPATNTFRSLSETVRAVGGGEVISDDPNEQVVAVVRPNHHFMGMPAGFEVRVSRLDFEGNQAALCSKAEYALITARASNPMSLAREAQLKAMREATSDAYYRSLSDEERAKLDAARKRAVVDDQRETLLRQEMAQAAKGPVADPKPVPDDLDAALAQLKASYTKATAGLSSRAKEALMRVEAQEIEELKQAHAAKQAKKQAGAQLDALGVRLQRLIALKDQGLISLDDFEGRKAQILAEV